MVAYTLCLQIRLDAGIKVVLNYSCDVYDQKRWALHLKRQPYPIPSTHVTFCVTFTEYLFYPFIDFNKLVVVGIR